MRHLTLYFILVTLASWEGAKAQCVLNSNMPPPFISSGYPVAWPKSGWRAANGAA